MQMDQRVVRVGCLTAAWLTHHPSSVPTEHLAVKPASSRPETSPAELTMSGPKA